MKRHYGSQQIRVHLGQLQYHLIRQQHHQQTRQHRHQQALQHNNDFSPHASDASTRYISGGTLVNRLIFEECCYSDKELLTNQVTGTSNTVILSLRGVWILMVKMALLEVTYVTAKNLIYSKILNGKHFVWRYPV